MSGEKYIVDADFLLEISDRIGEIEERIGLLSNSRKLCILCGDVTEHFMDFGLCDECCYQIAKAHARQFGQFFRSEDLWGVPSKKPKKERISNRIRKAVFERDKYRCVHCGTWESLSVDHIIPESKGGTLAMDNLQTLCRSCNSRKGAK